MMKEATAVSATHKGDQISISISVQITCTDLTGKHFSEVVQTVNVSRNGCCLLLKQSLSIGQKIHLQRMGSREEAHGRVVGQTGICSEGNLYGIEVLNSDKNFWGIPFPHQNELEEGCARVLLKCSTCPNCEQAALNEVEFSVFQITHHLTRKCQVCSADTVWEAVPHKAEAGGEQNGEKTDKRKNARISMKTVACIGPPGIHADVVDVNVSRGGVCFHSSTAYGDDAWVQVAVPYMPGSANIFVAGRIVRSRKLDGDQTEYGVEYAKS